MSSDGVRAACETVKATASIDFVAEVRGSAPDGRTVGTRAALEPEFLRCPVHGCHMGPDANVYRAVVTGPDGRQRSVRGCLRHLAGSVEQALSAIRLEPFE